ncbi:MAG: DEAD/DEAH box helicase [Deltaproteobacteria bacterium]|nr:DEAD/DEAH box helicase [Deltaproteobacteria bacterium]
MLFPRRDLDDVISDLAGGRLLPGDVTSHQVRGPHPPRYGAFPEDLAPSLREALAKRGIERPYLHQEAAIRAVRGGEHVVLTTPTASGKTLCYNVPIIDRILAEPETRALYVFPTKALAQDQYHGVKRLIDAAGGGGTIGTYTFDGDTPGDARRAVRDFGHIVITNPDMLHSGVLPQHTKWLKLFENLRYVVIDELHNYRGIFGSHVAGLLRRLRRVCRFHGSDPQFITCSATIKNPVELARTLVGVDFTHVAESGAPSGEHHIVTYNPPVVNKSLGIRAGAVTSAYQVARSLIEAGTSTIVFAGSRLHVEIILKYLREALVRANLSPDLVQGYRGGYLPLHRRRIEAGLRAGTIRGVVTTNALEAGIDIGSLDAAVICGFPGSIASFWQQSGRAGRRAGKSLTVLVASSASVDQYLVQHPDVLLGASPEQARIDPKNLFVMVDHAKCAAFELPFEPDEAFSVLTPPETKEVLEYLESHGVVNESAGRFHWMERVFPAHHVSLRGISEQNFAVIDVARDKVIAEVDFRSTHTTLHQHAIYHVDSFQYQVERLDYENHKAFVRKVDPDYYTTAMTYTRVAVLDEERSDRRGLVRLAHGEVLVTTKFVGFKKIRFHTNETIGYGDIHLPDLEMHTTSFWLEVDRELVLAMPFDRQTFVDALQAISHALETSAAIALMCAERDLGRALGEDAADGPGAGGAGARAFDPTIYLYDAVPGGVGLAPEIHKGFPAILARALELLGDCACGTGCPSCVGPMPRYDGVVRRAALHLGRALTAELERAQAPPPQIAPTGVFA